MTDTESMHDFANASSRVKALKSNWEKEITETTRRRDVRYVNISVDQLRATKAIQMDATYIPRRIADCNIRREQAPYISYMSQSKDTAKFRALDRSVDLPPQPLENEFTGFSQYDRWQIPFYQTTDGAQMHGWDAIETLFDETKPGHFCNRHIGHDSLWFALDVLDIQDAPVVVVLYGATTTELDEYVTEFDFNAEQALEVREKAEAQQNKEETKVPLFKVYFKEDGVVWVGWQSDQASDWLKAPEKLTLGKQTKAEIEFETEYPIEILSYTISENGIITEGHGRVFMDEHDQEACTQLVTAFTNRAIRSSYLMFAPKIDDGTAKKQTEVSVKDGIMFPNPVEEFHIDPPDPSILQAMLTITNQNANEIGQVNFAVANRKDSRKTATEMNVASQQSAMLNSVQVTLLSIFLRNVWTRCWKIVRSQVLQGKIESSIAMWEKYYNREYTLLAAGDVDVIRRQEIVQAMKQDWPVMQTTAAAQPFLEDLIRMSPYAEQADKYIAAIEAGNKKDNLIKGMATALHAVSLDPTTGRLKPDLQQFAPQLQEIQTEYQAVMGPPDGQGQPGQEQPAEQQAA